MLPPKTRFTSKKRLISSTSYGSLPRRPISSLSPPQQPKLSLLADECKSISQLKQVHSQMIVTSRIQDHFTASRLLSFASLSDSNDLGYALKLFESTRNPNMFMWNTLIRAFSVSPNPNKALNFYMKMRRFCVSPNTHTFPFVLKACYGLSSIECCRQVHTHVLKFGFVLDSLVVNGLIKGYCVSSDLSDARKVFDELSNRDLSVWTTMITGYAQNLFDDEALLLFDRMVSEGLEPNEYTLASVLSACARSGSLHLGKRIHVFMRDKGIGLGVVLGTALVYMYAKSGAISMAAKLFESMPDRNIATWNAMICGLANHGHTEEALTLFRNLEMEGIRPNDITFVGVLSACCHGGLIDVGREIFCSIKEAYGIDPKIEHYGCMVNLLGRKGKLEEAEELIEGMAWKADVVILGALLTSCRSHGNIEIAERVAKNILALEPEYHMVYVVLSNMYAEAGRWKDVSRLRKVMKIGKLNKAPGWSLVDE